MKPYQKALLLIEVFVCFAPAVVLLAAGGTMLMFQLQIAREPGTWPELAPMTALIASGTIGLIALLLVLVQLCRENGAIKRPLLVLLCVAIAAVPLVPYAVLADDEFAFVGLLALAATGHILFLSRRLLPDDRRKIYLVAGWLMLVIVAVGMARVLGDALVETEEEARDREMYAPPRKVEMSDAERASLDALVATITRTSRESYDSGDWSKFASLYPAGSLECWNASGEDHRFGFLSRRGMPDAVAYELIDRRDYVESTSVFDVEHFEGTHVLIIRYTTSAFATCEIPSRGTWPQEHLYVRRIPDGFQLAHPCPSRDQVENRKIANSWPVATRRGAMAVAESMDELERRQLRDRVKKDGFALNAIFQVAGKYRISEEQATEVVDAVCGLMRR